MNTTPISRIHRSAARALAVLLLALGVCLPLGGQPASAYGNSGWGNPGGAIPVAAAYNGLYGLVVPGVYVGRSPGSRDTQFVTARMHVNEWRPAEQRWVRIRTGSQSISMLPGQAFGIVHAVTVPVDYRRYYNVEVEVIWENGYGGTFGSNTIHLVHAGDYRCGYSACTVGQGWIYF